MEPFEIKKNLPPRSTSRWSMRELSPHQPTPVHRMNSVSGGSLMISPVQLDTPPYMSRLLISGYHTLSKIEVEEVLSWAHAHPPSGKCIARRPPTLQDPVLLNRDQRARQIGTSNEAFYVHVHAILETTCRKHLTNDTALQEVFVRQFCDRSEGQDCYNRLKRTTDQNGYILPPLFVCHDKTSDDMIQCSARLFLHVSQRNALVIPVSYGRTGLLQLKELYKIDHTVPLSADMIRTRAIQTKESATFSCAAEGLTLPP